MKLTAAHRSLPFGTVLEVTNPASGLSVEVRINDRGPFVGDRVIDLSYAAARSIGMVEAGVAHIQARVVRMGLGEREPPEPYVVSIPPAPETITAPPEVAFPLPGQTASRPAPAPAPAPEATEDDAIDVVVIEERGGQTIRKRVAADGQTIETVTEDGTVIRREQPVLAGPERRAPSRAASPDTRFVVQLGAFGSEANARALRDRIAAIDSRAFVELRTGLHRVRVGPFVSKESAQAAARKLENAGFPGIVLTVE